MCDRSESVFPPSSSPSRYYQRQKWCLAAVDFLPYLFIWIIWVSSSVWMKSVFMLTLSSDFFLFAFLSGRLDNPTQSCPYLISVSVIRRFCFKFWISAWISVTLKILMGSFPSCFIILKLQDFTLHSFFFYIMKLSVKILQRKKFCIIWNILHSVKNSVLKKYWKRYFGNVIVMEKVSVIVRWCFISTWNFCLVPSLCLEIICVCWKDFKVYLISEKMR